MKEIVNLSSDTTSAVAEVEFSEESNEATRVINEKASRLLQSIENLK